MLRPRRNWTRGVAAQHASLSRWRSPVRIRSGPPSPHFPTPRPPARTGRSSCPGPVAPARRRPIRRPLADCPPRDPTPRSPIVAGLVARGASSPCRSAGSAAGRRSPAPSTPSAAAATAGAAPARPAPRPRAAAVGGEASRRPPSRQPGRRRPPPRRHRRRAAIVPVTQLPLDRHDRHGRGRSPRSWPARAAATTALDLVERRGRRDPRRARRRRADADPDPPRRSPTTRRPSPRTSPRTASGSPSCAPTPSAPAVRALAWGGDRAVRRRPGQDARRLAADARPAGAADGPTRSTRRRPGPCSPAATSCSTAASTRPLKSQGRGLPVRRRDGRHHRPLQGLLVVRLGPAVHEADRQRRRRPGPHRGRRHRHRQLREPGAGPAPLPHVGDHLLGRPAAHRRPRRRRHRLRLARQQPHPRRRRRPASSRRSRTSRSAASRSRARARTSTAARKPAILEAAGTKVAILGYDAIAGGYHATATRAGSAGLSAKAVKADVAAARKAGADVVIVYPALGHRVRPDAVRRTSRSWPR